MRGAAKAWPRWRAIARACGVGSDVGVPRGLLGKKKARNCSAERA